MMNFIKTLRLTDTGLISLVHTPQSVCSFVVLGLPFYCLHPSRNTFNYMDYLPISEGCNVELALFWLADT